MIEDGMREVVKDKGWNILLAYSLFYYPFIITNNKQIVCMKYMYKNMCMMKIPEIPLTFIV